MCIIAVDTFSATIVPVAKQCRIHGICFDIPDFNTGIIIIIINSFHWKKTDTLSGGRDHDAACNLNFWMYRTGFSTWIIQMFTDHMSGICDIKDLPALMIVGCDVEIIVPVHYLKCHLKTRLPVQIVRGNQFHIFT